jgi:hypothetical protein
MTREELEAAFDRWTAAVKAADLDPLTTYQLHVHVADGIRSLPSFAANKGGQPPLLEAVAQELEGIR